MANTVNTTADSPSDSQQLTKARKVPRAERLAQLGLRFTKGLPEDIRELVRARPTAFRYVLSDGKSGKAVPGLYLRVGISGESVFWLQYKVRLGEAKGQRRQLKIGTVTLEAARREARQVLARVEGGGDPLAEEKAAKVERERARAATLGAYFDDVYEPGVLAHQADTSTALRFRKVWGPLFAKPLSAISPADVDGIIAARVAAGVKAGTAHRDFAMLRAALRFAAGKRCRLLAAPPACVAEKPVPIAGRKMRPSSRVRYLRDELLEGETESERARFMRELEKAPLLLLVVARLALATGMRRGNIIGLTDSKIHGDHILVPAAETKAGKDLTVWLNGDAKRALSMWSLRGMKGELFPLQRFGGSKLALERKIERAWRRLCRRAKVEDFHFHDSRHDFASRLLRSGATLAMVRDALGHSSITMTERYAHLERRDLRAAVQAVTL